MRSTVERLIDPAAIDAFYATYAAAFGPMRTRAAARHLLTAAEFAGEMVDERIEKHVVRADDGEPLALTTMTGDLSAVAWISPDFYAARYPDAIARGALYYLGYTLVRPERASHGLVRAMLDRIVERLVRERAVCVFDVSAYNDRGAVGRYVSGLARRHDAHIEAVDVQTYYGVTFGDPAGDRAGDPPGTGTGGTRLVSLAERPDLTADVERLLASGWPAFMLAGHPGHGVDLTALLLGTPRHQLVLLDPDGGPLCVGLSVPVDWDGTAGGLPAGWDGAVAGAAAPRNRGGAPGAVCALSITTAPQASGRGLAADMVAALKAVAAEAGAGALITPLRPVLKARYPLTPMAEFVDWRTPDGRPFDPWIRLHLRLGGVPAGIADPAMTLTGTVAQWETWTGLPLPATGEYVIPAGLVPLRVDRQADSGVYREPNLWIVHRAA